MARNNRSRFLQLRNAIREFAWITDPAGMKEFRDEASSEYDDLANKIAEHYSPGAKRYRDREALEAWLSDFPEPLDGEALKFLMDLASVAAKHMQAG